jgi:hypothetical protein
MDIHPLTNHQIGRLNDGRRLVEAEAAWRVREARAAQPCDRGADRRNWLERIRNSRRRRAAALSALLVVVGLALASSGLALARDTPWSWTESKAAKMVARAARVKLPPAERAALESELRRSMRVFVLLQLAAGDGEARMPELGHSAPTKYRRALAKVQEGLEIDGAECKGRGAAVQGSRFKRFRCAVTSETIEIPSASLVPPQEEGGLPTLLEGTSRFVGPLEAELDVHVAGRSPFRYRQVG